jgi:hypothetical protein
MTVTLTGTPSAVADRAAPTISAPAGSDAPSAASNNAPDQALLNLVASLKAHGGLLDVAGTWSVLQTFVGALFANGTSTDPAVTGQGSASKPGVLAKNIAGGFGLEVGAGNAKFSGANPALAAAYANFLGPSNIVKAWGTCGSTGTGSVSATGFNVTGGAANGGNKIRVTLASAITGLGYAIVSNCGATPRVVSGGGAGAVFDVYFANMSGTLLDPASNLLQASFVVLGEQ